jgi:hypothetical protein
MHIHGPSMNLSGAQVQSAAGAERAAAAERAADVRRKLAAGAQGAGGASSPEETLMIGQWMDSRHSQTQSADEYRTSAEGRNPDFG